ncbi:amino acid ABC transporter permease [Deinococcus sp.]|uniref:amino acid ABC transporter permease n=1 Tax=Deinococcus sp. TaxID=47478 RepID=UPI0025ED0432|nr:amino acid ABC transporter permease [Deinococcus sp.]
MKLIDTFFNLKILVEAFPALLRGLLITLELGVVSALVGTLLGAAVALLGLYGPGWLRGLVRVYIDVLRSMPLLVFMVLIYYALPFVKVLLPAFTSAVLAIGLIASAYVAEIVRSGIEAIPPGQFEAARSLGLRSWDVMRSVILPQALRIVVPPLTGNAVSIMKDTATASVVALPELLQQATSRQALAANPTPLIGAAIIYVALLFPLVRLVSRFENRAKRRAGR